MELYVIVLVEYIFAGIGGSMWLALVDTGASSAKTEPDQLTVRISFSRISLQKYRSL